MLAGEGHPRGSSHQPVCWTFLGVLPGMPMCTEGHCTIYVSIARWILEYAGKH